jgi:S-(hydroxymethyl)glutathione dehydrogenase/alcohol dehydrogenase
LTDGRGADYVFVTVGNPEAVEQGLGLIRREGTVVVVGIPARGATIPLDVANFMFGSQRLLSCNMGSTRLSLDIPRLVALYRQGRLKLDELITERFSLDNINAAIASTESRRALRNVVMIAPAA